jgi:hypothetical protein
MGWLHQSWAERQVLSLASCGQLVGYLGPELSKVMIEVEISMTHAFGLGHFPIATVDLGLSVDG